MKSFRNASCEIKMNERSINAVLKRAHNPLSGQIFDGAPTGNIPNQYSLPQGRKVGV